MKKISLLSILCFLMLNGCQISSKNMKDENLKLNLDEEKQIKNEIKSSPRELDNLNTTLFTGMSADKYCRDMLRNRIKLDLDRESYYKCCICWNTFFSGGNFAFIITNSICGNYYILLVNIGSFLVNTYSAKRYIKDYTLLDRIRILKFEVQNVKSSYLSNKIIPNSKENDIIEQFVTDKESQSTRENNQELTGKKKINCTKFSIIGNLFASGINFASSIIHLVDGNYYQTIIHGILAFINYLMALRSYKEYVKKG